jgi:hypothetical protein
MYVRGYLQGSENGRVVTIGYAHHTLQGDNSLKSVERFDHMMFVCRFQASR